jgi:hypothetical protein
MSEPWLFRVDPYPEESLGHFLGRFRRANILRTGYLAAMLGVSKRTVSCWEVPSRRLVPDGKELEKLSQLIGVEETRLRAMWASKNTELQLQTRLCAKCYSEAPCHKWTWQRASTAYCDRHGLPLLAACPQCGNDFLLPVYWEKGQCDRCGLIFREMVPHQHCKTGKKG